jgi:cell division GTPase FtsZ
MKEHLSNTNISRREALKGMAALGAIALLPKLLISSSDENLSIHFIGLGGAGSNQVEFLYNKGVKGKFTCISNPLRPHLPKEIKFVNFIPPGEIHYKNGVEILRISDLKQPIKIPDSILKIFDSNEAFVLLSGLGGYTGTFMTEELTLLLNQRKCKFLTVSSLPFKFEVKKRRFIAVNTINKLKNIGCFQYYELENIKAEYGDLTLRDAFEKANEQLYEIYIANALA